MIVFNLTIAPSMSLRGWDRTFSADPCANRYIVLRKT